MTSDPKQQAESIKKPQAASLLNKFMNFVERLPMPYWLTYLVLFIVQSAIIHILAWIDGWLPAYTSNPVLFVFPLWQWAPLAIMTYLDSVSLRALYNFSPLLEVEEETLERLKIEFTSMPARGVMLSSVLWGIIYAILNILTFEAFYVGYGLGPFFSIVIIIEGLLAFLVGSAIY